MPTPISSILPVSPVSPTADAATAGIALQTGSVVDAKVVGVLADNLVRIAIANLSMDVMSEVALTPGQNLQLAVSQSGAGIRLAIVNGAAGEATDSVTLTPQAATLTASPSLAPSAAPVRNVLTPLERIAVSMAAAEAATEQGSQAPLFANLASVVTGSGLPAGLKQAVLNVLAQQTPLDSQLGGGDIETAFQKSGLFLEASLASGTVPASGSVPDLKAALLVLRQTLATLEAQTPQAAAPAVMTAASQPGGSETAGRAIPAPPLAPEGDASPPQQALPVATPAGSVMAAESRLGASPRTIATGIALSLLQDATQEQPRLSGALPAKPAQDGHAVDTSPRAVNVPPPFRGALPSAQAVAPPSLLPEAPLTQAVHRLLDDTDAAIARQTLLQVASLPDRTDASGHRIDPAVPQWNFETPFATPQGSAMAQFEISRDGGGAESEPADKSWRARFSLNIEPAGPVHALVTLSGDKTFVRMWAERPATALALRAGAGELSQALAKADLEPGEIVVRDGTPPQPAPARAGHFLDRAT
jgi:hypothetical protein